LTSFCNTLAQWLLFNLSEYYVPSYGYVAERAALDMTLRIRPGLAKPRWQLALGVPEYIIMLAGLGMC
jgi:hypothetical protein